MLKQVWIYAENKKGCFRNITGLLVENDINILGSVTNDSAEYGIIRMVVSDPEKCIEVLKGAGFIMKGIDELMGSTYSFNESMTGDIWALNGAASAGYSGAGWYSASVPEPTSGLLLLLGMAGLALKRKRA